MLTFTKTTITSTENGWRIESMRTGNSIVDRSFVATNIAQLFEILGDLIPAEVDTADTKRADR